MLFYSVFFLRCLMTAVAVVVVVGVVVVIRCCFLIFLNRTFCANVRYWGRQSACVQCARVRSCLLSLYAFCWPFSLHTISLFSSVNARELAEGVSSFENVRSMLLLRMYAGFFVRLFYRLCVCVFVCRFLAFNQLATHPTTQVYTDLVIASDGIE